MMNAEHGTMNYKFIIVLVLSLRFCCSFRYRTFLRHGSADLAPDEINRNTYSHNQQPRPGLRRLKNEKHDSDYCRANNVKRGDDWITKGFVRSLSVRPLRSEHYDSQNRENVKDERRRDDVRQQIVVERSEGAVLVHGPRQDQ